MRKHYLRVRKVRRIINALAIVSLRVRALAGRFVCKCRWPSGTDVGDAALYLFTRLKGILIRIFYDRCIYDKRHWCHSVSGGRRSSKQQEKRYTKLSIRFLRELVKILLITQMSGSRSVSAMYPSAPVGRYCGNTASSQGRGGKNQHNKLMDCHTHTPLLIAFSPVSCTEIKTDTVKRNDLRKISPRPLLTHRDNSSFRPGAMNEIYANPLILSV